MLVLCTYCVLVFRLQRDRYAGSLSHALAVQVWQTSTGKSWSLMFLNACSMHMPLWYCTVRCISSLVSLQYCSHSLSPCLWLVRRSHRSCRFESTMAIHFVHRWRSIVACGDVCRSPTHLRHSHARVQRCTESISAIIEKTHCHCQSTRIFNHWHCISPPTFIMPAMPDDHR
jgi:hypothetical protein